MLTVSMLSGSVVWFMYVSMGPWKTGSHNYTRGALKRSAKGVQGPKSHLGALDLDGEAMAQSGLERRRSKGRARAGVRGAEYLLLHDCVHIQSCKQSSVSAVCW